MSTPAAPPIPLRELLRSPLLQRELGWAYCKRWLGMKPALVLPALLLAVLAASVGYGIAKGRQYYDVFALAQFMAALVMAATGLHMLTSAPRVRQSLGDRARVEELLSSPIRSHEVALALLLGRGTSLAYAFGATLVAAILFSVVILGQVDGARYILVWLCCFVLPITISVLALLPSLYIEGVLAGLGSRAWLFTVAFRYVWLLAPFAAALVWYLVLIGEVVRYAITNDLDWPLELMLPFISFLPPLILMVVSVSMLRRRLRRAVATMQQHLDAMMEEA